MASQAKQRLVAMEWRGNDYTVEEAPFLFPVKNKKGVFELLSAPWGYVNDLTNHVLDNVRTIDRLVLNVGRFI